MIIQLSLHRMSMETRGASALESVSSGIAHIQKDFARRMVKQKMQKNNSLSQQEETVNQQKGRDYRELVKQRSPKSKTVLMCFKAFLVGGLICSIGQVVQFIGTSALNLSEEDVAAFTAIVMVFLGATLTGIGIYDKIGSFAGAGSVVPITGFANSIVAPAMEHKPEGYVMGVGAKLFSLAGPVLVYGISSSILVGLLALIFP